MKGQAIKIFLVVAAVVALAVAVPHTSSFVMLLVTRALAFSILVMSLDFLLGFTGLASMGQAAYLGVGAYLTAILATRYQFGLGYDFWLVLVFGILLGAALAAVFGLLAIRATGVYFLMITLALGQCVWGLAYRWNSLTGGDNGINLRARPKFGIDLANEVTFFYLVFFLFAVSLLLMYTLVRWWQYALGAVYVLTILYLPTGLMGIPERLRQRRAATGNREDVKKMAPVTS